MILGVPSETVKLCPHDDEWIIAASQTIQQLEKDLRKYKVNIQHVGSTCIPTIMSNPVIDIAIGVECPEDIKRVCGWFSRHGYAKCKTVIPQAALFCLEKDGLRCYQFFVVDIRSMAWDRLTKFRNFLNRNNNIAQMYNRTNLSNCNLPYNEYLRQKDSLVEAILKRLNRL